MNDSLNQKRFSLNEKISYENSMTFCSEINFQRYFYNFISIWWIFFHSFQLNFFIAWYQFKIKLFVCLFFFILNHIEKKNYTEFKCSRICFIKCGDCDFFFHWLKYFVRIFIDIWHNLYPFDDSAEYAILCTWNLFYIIKADQ